MQKMGERQNKRTVYSHFFLQTCTFGSLVLQIAFTVSLAWLAVSLGQWWEDNLVLYSKAAISCDPRNEKIHIWKWASSPLL